MKTVSNFSALPYEAPQTEVLLIRVERNLLDSQTGTGSGQGITYDTESDFDEYFGS